MQCFHVFFMLLLRKTFFFEWLPDTVYGGSFYFYFLQELSSDSSQHVRSALAAVIMGMAPVLGKVSSRAIVHHSRGKRKQ